MSIDSSQIDVLVLTGPTASGKTDLLDRVFGGGVFFSKRASSTVLKFSDGRVAEKAEIISVDSMQAYRGMDIGTSKPTAELRGRLYHHLIDIKDPSEQYTAGEFARLADALCASLWRAGILPIVAGGTGFYLKNFICGPPSGPKSDPETRAGVLEDLTTKGVRILREELESVDPEIAAKIHQNDVYRLTRALEIWRSSGEKPSRFAPANEARPGYRFLTLGIERPRGEINGRIDDRVDEMFREGLADEVAGLVRRGCGPSDPGMKAIGYREFFEDGGADIAKVIENVKLHTRQYAKRQMTFFRSLPGIAWIPPSPGVLFRLVANFLSGPH